MALDACVFLLGVRATDGAVVGLVSFKGSVNPLTASVGALKMTGPTNIGEPIDGPLQKLCRPNFLQILVRR